jgi:hypothetical protein
MVILNGEIQKSAKVTLSDKEKAQAALDFGLAKKEASERAAKLATDEHDRGLKDAALNWSKQSKIPIVQALTSNDPNLDPDTRTALLKDEGVWRDYMIKREDDREALRVQHEKDLVNYRENKQKTSLDDQIQKHDAQTKADLYTRTVGKPINGLDVFYIDKFGLGPQLDKVVNMTPQQIQAAVTPDSKTGQVANPMVATLITQHPNIIESYKGMKEAVGKIQDKDLETQRVSFDKALMNVNNEVLKKATKAKGETDKSVIQEQIQSLQNHPYAAIMREKGTPIDISVNKEGGFLGFGGSDVLKVGTGGDRISKAVDGIISGQYDRAATLADPNITPEDKKAILAELKKRGK